MAADAVQFTRLTWLLVLHPTSVEKRGEFAAEDQHRPLPVNGREAVFDPRAHGVPVNAKEAGGFLDGVGAVNLDESMIRVAFSHSAPSER